MATPVLRHRVLLNFHAESDRIDTDEILRQLIAYVTRPQGELMLQRFLDPAVLAGISSLDLLAKTVVDGFVAGLHRSPDFGFSQEFAEYRAYTPGDDLRHVDWNLLCAHRALLHQALPRRDQQPAHDSARCQQLHAVHLRPAQQNGLRAFHRRIAFLSGDSQPARRGRAHRLRRRGARLYPAFYTAGATGAPFCGPGTRRTALPHQLLKPLEHFQNFLHRRGIAIVISDFYENPETIIETIAPLRFHGHEVILFHILDPHEIRPEFKGPALLVDLETQTRMEVIPEYVKTSYRAKVDAHIEALRDKARANGLDYQLLVTDRPLDAALREYLTLRQEGN